MWVCVKNEWTVACACKLPHCNPPPDHLGVLKKVIGNGAPKVDASNALFSAANGGQSSPPELFVSVELPILPEWDKIYCFICCEEFTSPFEMMSHCSRTHGRTIKNYWDLSGEHWATALKRFFDEHTDIKTINDKFNNERKARKSEKEKSRREEKKTESAFSSSSASSSNIDQEESSEFDEDEIMTNTQVDYESEDIAADCGDE